MKCSKCGAVLTDDTKFCSYCGQKIEKIQETVSETPPQSNSNAPTEDYRTQATNGAGAPNKVSISGKIKDKGTAFWNKLSAFGKVSTIAIALFALLCLIAFLAGKIFAGVISLVQIVLVIVALLMHKGTIRSPQTWLKYLVLAAAVLFTVLNVMSYSWGDKKPSSSSDFPSSQTQVTDQPIQTPTATNYSIQKDSEYAYMSDEWNVYIATAISDSLIKVENWDKSLSSDRKVKFNEDIGTFKINDPANGFSWVDDEHTAFYMTLKDKNNSRLKNSITVLFTINISDSDTNKGSDYSENIICYTYTNDDWHMYRAIPLTENLIKVEVWYRGSSADKFLYGYDMCVINPNSADTDFEWTDEEHTSFTITTKDPANDYYWKQDTFVAFIAENEDAEYKDVMSFLGSKIAGEGEVKVPSSASSFKYEDYQDVEKALSAAGFTNISTEIKYDIVWGWTDEGEVDSVSIDGRTDYEEGTVFKKDVSVIITYHMKEEDDPANQEVEVSESPTESPETDPPTETPAPTDPSGVILPTSDSKLGKDFDSKGSNTVYYINVDGTANVPKLKDWGTAKVTDSVYEYLDYLESLGYTITVTSTDYREPYSGFHAYDTDFKVSNSTVSWTMSLYIQDEDYVEYELDINLP